jgi:hypothetical protein
MILSYVSDNARALLPIICCIVIMLYLSMSLLLHHVIMITLSFYNCSTTSMTSWCLDDVIKIAWWCGDKVLENGDFLSCLLSQRRGHLLRTRRRPCLEDRQSSPARLYYYELSVDLYVVGQSSFCHHRVSNKEG